MQDKKRAAANEMPTNKQIVCRLDTAIERENREPVTLQRLVCVQRESSPTFIDSLPSLVKREERLFVGYLLTLLTFR
jgi:hypothetical protein